MFNVERCIQVLILITWVKYTFLEKKIDHHHLFYRGQLQTVMTPWNLWATGDPLDLNF